MVLSHVRATSRPMPFPSSKQLMTVLNVLRSHADQLYSVIRCLPYGIEVAPLVYHFGSYFPLRITILQPVRKYGIWLYNHQIETQQYIAALESYDGWEDGEVVARAGEGPGHLSRIGFLPLTDIAGLRYLVVDEGKYPLSDINLDTVGDLFRIVSKSLPSVPGAVLKANGSRQWLELAAGGSRIAVEVTTPTIQSSLLKWLTDGFCPRIPNTAMVDQDGNHIPLSSFLPERPRLGLAVLDANSLLFPDELDGLSFLKKHDAFPLHEPLSFTSLAVNHEYIDMTVQYDRLDGSTGRFVAHRLRRGEQVLLRNASDYLHVFRPELRTPPPIGEYYSKNLYRMLSSPDTRIVLAPTEVNFPLPSNDNICVVRQEDGYVITPGWELRPGLLVLEVIGIQTRMEGKPVFLIPGRWLSNIDHITSSLYKELNK